MEEFSIKELKKIISDGDFDSLIGKIENDFFDCKSQSYNLKKEYSKRELAKDVSSFANLNGGYILIGPKTDKSKTNFGDEITEIALLNQTLVNLNQYKDVIKDWIYPDEIQGIKVYWKAKKNNKNKGIIVIEIPPQKESLKPFLISKIVEEERKISETIFGYAERKGDRSDPKKIKDIYRIMRDGLLYDKNIENRFDNLESLLASNQQQTQREEQIQKNEEIGKIIRERINTILKVSDMKNQRAIILIAYPENRLEGLKSLFTNTEDSIKRKLEKPPTIRYGGWSLETLDQGKIIKGQLVRVTNGDVKTIDLYKDGNLIFAGLADNNFLAWGENKSNTCIHPLALIELIYNFILFYSNVINDFVKRPNTISIKFGFKNMHLENQKNYLIPGSINSIAYMFDIGHNKRFAPENEHFSEPINFDVKNFDIPKIAYKVTKEIYLWFGIPLDNGNIPYTKKLEDSSVIIDVNQIKK